VARGLMLVSKAALVDRMTRALGPMLA